MTEESSSAWVSSDLTGVGGTHLAIKSDKRSVQASGVVAATAHRHIHHEEAQMREEDDTILEVGIGHSRTPVLKPIHPPPSGVAFSGIGEDGAGVDAMPFLPPSASVRYPVSRLSCGNTRTGGCQGKEVAGMQPPPPSYRRCLSGDDGAVATFGSLRKGVLSLSAKEGDESTASLTGEHDVASVSGSLSNSVTGDSAVLGLSSKKVVALDSVDSSKGGDEFAPLPTELVAVPATQETLDDRDQRSKSMARLLNEAAQFAEAVGEAPPTTEDEIVVIQEDSSSDDDDDDDEGTVVDVHDAVDALSRPLSTPYRKEASVVIRDDQSLLVDDRSTASEEQGARNSIITQRTDNGCASASQMQGGLPDEAHSKDEVAPARMDCKSPRDSRRPKAESSWLSKRFGWPPRAQSAKSHHLTLLGYVPDGDNGTDVPGSSSGLQSGQQFAYRGIHANPPEITKRGISRGNYAQLHRKAWLEVSDKYHRYGKNLRMYYKHWESQGHPTNMFFDWLDSKNEGAGKPLPNLPECPRCDLDSDTVLYITNPEVQASYALDIVMGETDDGCEGILIDSDGDPVRTGPEGWIFVLRDHVLYGAPKVTSISGKSKQRFHHSSFFGGKAVAAAGILITDDSGRLKRLYPHSGHYRPGEGHMQRMLYFLQKAGVDLTTFDVDLQQILHVSRTIKDANTPKGGAVDETDHGNKGGAKKAKKVDSLHLKPALYVACLLAHKARMIGEGVFSQIHKIRAIGAVSVTEALVGIDGGGYWKNLRLQL